MNYAIRAALIKFSIEILVEIAIIFGKGLENGEGFGRWQWRAGTRHHMETAAIRKGAASRLYSWHRWDCLNASLP